MTIDSDPNGDVRRAEALTAEAWVVLLEGPDCSPADHEAFEAWLAASPINPRLYAEAERIYLLSAQLASDPRLVAQARRARHDTMRRPARLPRLVLLAAALGVVCLFAYRFVMVAPAPHEVRALETRVGQRMDTRLDDGSQVTLDADTRVMLESSASRRLLTLQRGRLFVRAARDPRRPMIVLAGARAIRVVGTVFQVHERQGEVDVALFEGALAVGDRSDDAAGAAVRLTAGQAVSYGTDGRVGAVHAASIQADQAWLHGQLVFSDRPLADLLREANRYSDTKIVLGDASLGEIKISGTFRAGDQKALLAALETGWGLRSHRQDRHRIVLERQ